MSHRLDVGTSAPRVASPQEAPATARITARRGKRSESAPKGIWRVTAPIRAAAVNIVTRPDGISDSMAKTAAMLEAADCTNEARMIPTTAAGMIR